MSDAVTDLKDATWPLPEKPAAPPERTAPPHHITVTIDTRTHRVVEINPEEKP